MKFGVCVGWDGIAGAAEAGFAYAELPVSALAVMTDAEFERAAELVRSAPIPCPRFNLLLPRSIRLLTGETSESELSGYLERAFGRMAALGGEIAVFGSGASRARPEGMEYGEAYRRLIAATRVIGGAAQRHGVRVAIEPLNRSETNMICSVAEGAGLMAAVDHPAVGLLADYYHIATDGECVSDIVRTGGVIHAHIAAKAGRRYPQAGTEDDFAGFFEALRATGYQGTVSVEGHTEDMRADAQAALRLMDGLWARG